MNGIAAIVGQINDAWRAGRVDELAAYFHPAMVIVGPGYEVLARGADDCVASYRDFLGASVVHQYQESKLLVHETDGVAVATYEWEMEYEQNGKRSRERGTDLFVFQKQGNGWQAVWRAVTFAPASP